MFSLEQIEKAITFWSHNLSMVKEGEALRYLQTLNNKPQETNIYKLKSKLYSLLAYARFTRLNKLDEISLEWLDEAMENDAHEPIVNEMYIKIYFEKLKEPLFSEQFPQIRETDHGNTKKQLANVYLNLANEFFDNVPTYESILLNLLNASQRMYDDEKIIKFETLTEILKQMKEPIRNVVKATEAYADSLKGIYYSQQQLQHLKEAIYEIEQLHSKWLLNFMETKEIADSQQENSLVELEGMVGLSDIKKRVYQLYHYLKYQKIRKEKGYQLKDELSLNMILTGNPGTGKTTLARLFAKIYNELGILPRQEVVEVDRSHLVGGFVGQTEENTINIIKQAIGGVLFIDEAYSLKRDGASSNDYGQTVIDTLVSAMTNSEYAGKFAVILAGYPEEMRQFLWANPGLRSRFPESNHIHLSDYTTEELIQIAETVALGNDFIFSNQAIIELKKRIEKEQVDTSFGNARTVKNIVQNAIFQKGSTVTLDRPLKKEDFIVLNAEDVKLREQEQETNTGLDQLDNLVGLASVKEDVKQLISFVKVQQLRQEKGLPTVPVQFHSVFSGDSGTGKTTVAKIYATILKDLDLLKRGHIVVTGRADLVSGYTGQTALKTKRKIREALGGVLFIDEAYSLLRGGQGDFGREVIDTLVEEMTKHNENLVVILAGYPNELKNLMNSNPGLASRFKKQFHFSLYTVSEIIEMVSYHARKLGYKHSDEAINFLQQKLGKDNQKLSGRYAVDLVNEAIIKHSVRMMKSNINKDIEQLSMLKEEDFL